MHQLSHGTSACHPCLTHGRNVAHGVPRCAKNLLSCGHSELVYKKQERYILLLFQLAERWKERFRTFKKERNLLDYNDMEKYLRDLLANKELAEEIRMGYRYLFVDEYQDCSPI